MGTWVYDAHNNYRGMHYTYTNGSAGSNRNQQGTMACTSSGDDIARGSDGVATRPACLAYTFVGAAQPDSVNAPPTPPPPPPPPPMPRCSIAGKWIQQQSGDTFGPFTEDNATGFFTWTGNPEFKKDGWNTINGAMRDFGGILALVRFRQRQASPIVPHRA